MVCEQRLFLGQFFSAPDDRWLSFHFYSSCLEKEQEGCRRPAIEARASVARLLLLQGWTDTHGKIVAAHMRQQTRWILLTFCHPHRWAGAGEAAGEAVYRAGNRERPARRDREAPQVQSLQNSVGDSQPASWLVTGSSGLRRSPHAAPGRLQHGHRVYISKSLYIWVKNTLYKPTKWQLKDLKHAQKHDPFKTFTNNIDIYFVCKKAFVTSFSYDNTDQCWGLHFSHFNLTCKTGISQCFKMIRGHFVET